MFKPLQNASQNDEYNVFTLTRDPSGLPHSDIEEVHAKLRKKLPNQSLVELQQKEFASIIKNLLKHKEKLSHLYVLDENSVLKRIVRENNEKVEVVMVPRELTKILLFEMHEILTHPGQLKMYMFLRRCYFWKNMRTAVTTFVRNCSACNRVTLKEPKYVDSMNVIPRYPMANIAIDLLGPFLPTSRGNERILTCMDLLTHYLFLVPIPDKQAETVVKAYTEFIYAEAGGFQYVLSDQGSEFTAETFKSVMNELGLKQVYGSPRNPTSNAVLERAYSFVKNKLVRIKVSILQVQWDDILAQIRFSYNITPSSGTG